jgi:hypothetical protein
MKLLRLLTAGRTMVGVKDSTGRYRMTDPRSMPKFESAKNPFRSKAETKAKQTELSAVAQVLQSSAKVEGKRVEVKGATEKRAHLVKAVDAPSAAKAREALITDAQKTEAERETDHRTKRACTLEVKFPAENDPQPQSALAVPVKKGAGLIEPNLASRWLTKISSVFSRSQTESARRVISQLGRTAVQGELSLDKVQVIRNDLSDSDLEVVRAKPPAKEKQGPSPADRPGQITRQHNNREPVDVLTM